MGAPAGLEGRGAELVGRDAELARLRAVVGQAALGRPGAVLLGGDAGVGKSRLLAAVATDELVVWGRCIDLGEVGLSYLPFAEALGEIARLVPSAVQGLPALAPLLPGAATDGSNPGGDAGRLQLFEAVARALRAAGEATGGPLVLVLEDLHWADGSSRELLRFLLARLRDEQLAVLASYRADDLHRRHPLRPLLAELSRLPAVERLDLAPLAPGSLREHLVAYADQPLPESLLSSVLERSEGNPYFAEELLTAALEAPGADDRALPERLSDVLLARLERLPEESLAVVRVAAVAGRRVSAALLAAVCETAGVPTESALREAVAAQILVPSGDAYAFRHALLQETVYDDLLPGERGRLHAAFAAVLGDDAPAAELGHHVERSGDLAAAYACWVRAAEEATAAHAPREALTAAERALGLAGAVPDRPAQDLVDLLLAAAAAAQAAGEVPRALGHTREAVRIAEEAGLDAEAAEARRRLVVPLLILDRDAEALEQAVAAQAVLAEGDPDGHARAAATYARVTLSLDRYEESRGAVTTALALSRERGLRDVEADALATLAVLEEIGGQPQESLETLERARVAAVAAGDLSAELRAAFNITAHHFYAGNLARAAVAAAEVAGRAEQVGLVWSPYGADTRGLQVIINYTVGDWDAAATLSSLPVEPLPAAAAESLTAMGLYVEVARGTHGVAERAGALAAGASDALAAMVASGCGADALLWQDDAVRAAELAAAGVRRLYASWGDASLGGIWLSALGVSAQARLAEQARERGDTAALATACATAERLHDAAQQVAARGRPRTGTLGPEGRAWLARAAAEHSRARGAADVAAWQAATDAFGYGHRYEQARSRWRLGEARAAAGDRDRATEELRVALAEAAALGARPLADAVRALARRRRIDVGQPVVAGPLLTPRELQVLELVAAGLTNRQVGARLFISEKTASVHLSNLMAKLGVSGRTEAVAQAARLGLLDLG